MWGFSWGFSNEINWGFCFNDLPRIQKLFEQMVFECFFKEIMLDPLFRPVFYHSRKLPALMQLTSRIFKMFLNFSLITKIIRFSKRIRRTFLFRCKWQRTPDNAKFTNIQRIKKLWNFMFDLFHLCCLFMLNSLSQIRREILTKLFDTLFNR
jgi:hypothetical protein